MKLSLTLHNKTYSIESDEGYDGSNVYELAEQFKGLLVNAGFHPSNVDSIFNLDCQWFTDEENEGNMQGHINFNKTNQFGKLPHHYDNEPILDSEAKDRMQKRIDQFQNNMYRQDDDKPL
jgi:hypothetical protein